jgi:3-demethoxyubiquinol 3-hydroxylase
MDHTAASEPLVINGYTVPKRVVPPTPVRGRPTIRGRLPGDGDAHQALARMIRVDHAGEFGAKQIYGGQIAVLKNSDKRPLLEHMAEQELEHLSAFAAMLVERRLRPTVMHPVWRVAAFALGAGTALLGEKAAMACTVAVETVIDEHYQHQLDQLGDEEEPLKKKVVQFQAEELEHRDIGLDHAAEQAPAYPVLLAAVKAATRFGIWLSQKI